MKWIVIAAVLWMPMVSYAAFPVQTPDEVLQATFNRASSIASNVKERAARARDELAGGDVDANRIISFAREMAGARQELNQLSSVSGLEQYVRDQMNDQTIDLTAEFLALEGAMEAFVEGVKSSIPVDGGSGFALLAQIGGGTGQIVFVWRTFTPAQTAGLQTLLQNIVDAVE